MSNVQDSLRRQDTFAKLLLHNAGTFGSRPAYREKEFGIWQCWTWAEVADNVRNLACGLADIGIRRGDKVAIVGSNRPHLYWSFTAIQAIGAVPVPIYQDGIAEEVRFVLDHAEVVCAIVEDQEQTDKLLDVRESVPSLRQIVYEDDRGMRHYEQEFLHKFRDLQERGRAHDKAHPDFYPGEVAKGSGDDIAVIAYTSGTTGRPKGVVLKCGSLIEVGRASVGFEGLTEREDILSYLPMAWVGDHLFSFVQAYTAGYTVNCPESADTVMTDLKEIGPTYFFAPPSIFENILTHMMIRIEDASAIKRRLFHYYMDVAKKVGTPLLEGLPVGLFDRLNYGLGKLLIYGPLKNTLGFSRIRVAYTAGAPMGPETFRFYRSLGINLKQLYGQTESAAYVCIQKDGDVRPDTVGPAAPGCEVRIDEASGEVLVKSPGLFAGYFKNDEATAETLGADGWLHTGDAGIMTDEGHLKVIDRAKDVGKLNDGTLFAPQYLENKLKFYPFIREAVCHGSGRDMVTAFINIDMEAVGNWAERNDLNYASYAELAAKPEIYALIRSNIEEVNRGLAIDSELAGSQIHRFLLLHKELDADDGELTRTRKVRRRVIAERYGSLIEGLYSDADHAAIEVRITYEDGRETMMNADLRIEEAETFPPQSAAEPLRMAS